jgi:prepilin-type N-terminal cleavage/methylation domain-containing protein
MNKKKAFTLMEVLIVLAIVGMIIGVGIPQVQRVLRTNLKTSAMRISGTIRLAYDSAVVKGTIHRIVFDFDKRSYKLEVSNTNELVSVEELSSLKKTEKEKKEEGEAEPAPSFSPYEGEAGKGNILPAGIVFDSVENVSLKKKVTSDVAYLYFFPQGMTEDVIIRLKSEKGERGFYSIRVNPADAKTKVEGRYIEAK